MDYQTLELMISEIDSLDFESKVEAINTVREMLHRVSPFKNEPVDFVKWVKNEKVVSNDYNPNKVAPPEMRLLEVSIMNDGYTQPIVAFPQDDEINEVVDGFHRSRVGKESKLVNKRVFGYLPIVAIRSEKTKISGSLFNAYPIYDWKTEDIWVFLGKNKHLSSNAVYSKMSLAGVKISEQRLCQPYGDDQKKGLWLYHILEPDTWYKLINRVSGVNSGALYVQENGNINGNIDVTKPEGVTWQEYCNMLLSTMPSVTRKNYEQRFKKFIAGWKKRGYEKIPDEAPHILEVKCWAPSWKRMCRSILRNDYYCKGLGQTQPLSEAYQKFKSIQFARRASEKNEKAELEEIVIPLFDLSSQGPQHEIH